MSLICALFAMFFTPVLVKLSISPMTAFTLLAVSKRGVHDEILHITNQANGQQWARALVT